MIRLSPLTRSALRHGGEGHAIHRPKRAGAPRRSSRMIVLYECPVCWERYDEESEADGCCDDDVDASVSPDVNGEPVRCPVCSLGYETEAAAADCCLWRDIDAPTRVRIARAVELGAQWVDAIAAETGDERVLA